MSENPSGGPAADDNQEFELLAAAPYAPDISGQLTPARAGGGIPKVTLGLIGAVLLAGGFVGGVVVGKHSGSSSSSKTAAGAKGGTRARGGYGGYGFGGGSGGSGTAGGASGGAAGGTRGGAVIGTVSSVSGSAITVTENNGTKVTVDIGPQTTITIGKTGSVSDLAAGSQVTVLGTPDGSGTVTARTVMSGVTGFGFGGRGGFGGPGRASSTPGGSNG